MTGPPSYRDTDVTSKGSGPPPGDEQRAGWSRWKTAAIAVIVIAVLTVMVILHLTGTLGAGTHG
jgi:hypothetical protein